MWPTQQEGTNVIARLLCGAALLGALYSPAFAEQGQVTIIGKDGQATTEAMPTDPKMVKMMHHMGHAMGKGPLMVWMDDKGSMHVCSCGEKDHDK
jgi:hypothetical protein